MSSSSSLESNKDDDPPAGGADQQSSSNIDLGVPAAPPTMEDLERDFGHTPQQDDDDDDDDADAEKIKKKGVKDDPQNIIKNNKDPVVIPNAHGRMEQQQQDRNIQHETTTKAIQSPSTSSWRSCKLVFYILIVVLLMAILGVGIAILIELIQANEENYNDTDGRNILPVGGSSDDDGANNKNDGPTVTPMSSTITPIPSATPTINKNDDCEEEEEQQQVLSFQSIANEPGARLLSGLQTSCFLGTHSCEAIVHLPFDFPNLNMNDAAANAAPPPRRTIYVTPSGMIRFYKYGYANEHCASECAGISIAKQGSIHESYQGDIWVLFATNNNSTDENANDDGVVDNVVVSWENVSFDNDPILSNLYNAQLTLFQNGNVQMCWGLGTIREPMQAVIWDNSLGRNSIAYMVQGEPFIPQNNNGITSEWPTNQCRLFDFERRQWIEQEDCSSSASPPPPPYYIPPTGHYTCEAPQVVSLDYYDPTATLADGVPFDDEEKQNPAWQCPRFVESYSPTQWYTFRGRSLTGTGSCICVELRSMDAPFILGVYRYATDEALCDDLYCIMDTDFTAESIVLRTSPNQKYKLAVSLLRGGTEEVNLGTYQLTIFESEAYCRDLLVQDQAHLLPGSC